ncbi:hypothetical protein WMZ97_07965 [Lentibacillus sp. N15]|uniref:hypothetical protein n=1 Tax=Lentibacillus songyuanensis TaxID=3136161 RepID=UPI0031BB5FE4
MISNNQDVNEIKIGEQLVHPDGRTVTFVKRGTDGKGDFLIIKHQMTKQGVLNGPHWHPKLSESFSVKEGRMRFLLDGCRARGNDYGVPESGTSILEY